MIAVQAAHILKENQVLAMCAMKSFHQNLTRAKTGAESFRRKESVNIKPMAQCTIITDGLVERGVAQQGGSHRRALESYRDRA
jgi:stalled ribosome alternative rescue factor ArfA